MTTLKGSACICWRPASSDSATRKVSPYRSNQGERQERHAQPSRIRKDREDRAAEQAVAERSWMATLDLAARGLDERGVLHAGRTRCHACHAAQTGVEMIDERRRHPGPPFETGLHQIDSAARRIHLLAPQDVGGARRQTEAAMHAFVDERRIRRVVGVECICHSSSLITCKATLKSVARRMLS